MTQIFEHYHLKSDWTYIGFNEAFFTIFKVPLLILASCITILGFISAIHRSAQFATQIRLTSEQHTFANFYQHKEDYIKHFIELKEEIPSHISDLLTEKIIRDFYLCSYPDNNSSYFTTTAYLEWVDELGKELIKICYFLYEILNQHNLSVELLLYKELMILESNLRANLFNISDSNDARIHTTDEMKVLIEFWTNKTSTEQLCKNPINTLINRLSNYADFLSKLKHLADNSEGTMLYSLTEYRSLKDRVRNYKAYRDSSLLEKFSSESNTDIYLKVTVKENEYNTCTETIINIYSLCEKTLEVRYIN